MAKVEETKVKISLIDSMSDKLDHIGQKMKGLGLNINSLHASFGKLAVTMAVTTGTLLVKAGRDVSKFSNQFISYAENAEQATQIYNKFNEVYRNTNYDEQKVYDLGKSFMNVGISAGESAKLIEKCADVSAKLGKGVEFAEELAGVFARLRTGGQLTEKQFKSLAEAGLDLTNIEKEMQQGGTVAFEALKAKCEEFSGSMAKSKQTAAEMEGDIKGNLVEIARQTALLIDDFFGFSDALKSFYQWVIDVSGKVIQSIKDMRNALSQNVASADAYGQALKSYGKEYDRVKSAAEQGDQAAAERLMVMHQQAEIMAKEAKDAEALRQKEAEITALESKRAQVKAISGGTKASGGGTTTNNSDREYERASERLRKLSDNLAVKAVEATKDTFAIGKERLKAEINDMNSIIAEAAKKGIDTSEVSKAVEGYKQSREVQLEEEKFERMHELEMQNIENQRTMGTISLEVFRNKNVQELTSYKKHLEELLKNDNLCAEERIKIQTKIAEAADEINANSALSWKEVWKDTLEEVRETILDQSDTVRQGIRNIFNDFVNFGQNLLTESKSFSERIRDLFKNLANDIFNMSMKFAMQGLLKNLFPAVAANGGYIGGKAFANGGYMGVHAYAAGGSAGRGWALVGERGPELVNFDQPGRVYNAEQTSKALSQSNGVNVRIDIKNESGTPVQAEQTGSGFDGESYVVGVVLKAISTNKNGMRNIIKGLATT